MSYFLIAILVYLLYRFITGFLLPVIRTTSQVRRQFNNMQDPHANQQYQQPSNNGNGRTTMNGFDQKPKYDVEGEYIKFEDIKD